MLWLNIGDYMNSVRVYTYTYTTYSQNVFLLVGKWPAVDNYMKQEFGVECTAPTSGSCAQTMYLAPADSDVRDAPIGIWMPSFDCFSPEDIATLVHECVHVVKWTLDSRGIYQSIKDKNMEVVAYPLQELTQGLLSQIFEKSKHRRKRTARKAR